MVPPPPLMPRGSGGVLGSVSVPQQQTPPSMLLYLCQLCLGSPQVGFFFRVEPPTILYLIYVWCLFWCLLFTFRCELDAIFTYGGSTIRVCTFATLWSLAWQAYVQPGDGLISPYLVCMEWLLPLLPWVGRAFCYSFSCTLTDWWGIQPWGLCRESPDPSAFLHDGEGSLFQVWLPSDDVVDSDSVMGIKPGDSGVVIGYQVDEFTCTWSAEWFVAHSHIYPGFTGKVSFLTHFPLE